MLTYVEFVDFGNGFQFVGVALVMGKRVVAACDADVWKGPVGAVMGEHEGADTCGIGAESEHHEIIHQPNVLAITARYAVGLFLIGEFFLKTLVATDALFNNKGPNQRFVVSLDDGRFGGAHFENVNFNNGTLLVFDEMGGPVAAPASSDLSTGGSLDIVGGDGTRFRLDISAFTGRIRVAEVEEVVMVEPDILPGNK